MCLAIMWPHLDFIAGQFPDIDRIRVEHLKRAKSSARPSFFSGRSCSICADFRVDLGPSTVRYPDVVVDVAGGRLKDLTATAPAMIAEVISPSSAKDDLCVKANEYVQLPSLSAYLVLAPDEPKARVWLLGAGGFSPKPKEGQTSRSRRSRV